MSNTSGSSATHGGSASRPHAGEEQERGRPSARTSRWPAGSRATTIATAPAPTSSVDAEEPEGDLARADVQVERRLERPRRRPRSPQPDERRDLERRASPRSRSRRRARASCTRPPLTNITRIVAATATSMARDGVPNFVCRKARRSDSAPSTDNRCSSCSASPSARCAAGTSSSAAAPMSATAIRSVDPRGSGKVVRQPGERRVRPERADRPPARAARTGTRPTRWRGP